MESSAEGFASYDVIDPSSGFAVAFEQRPAKRYEMSSGRGWIALSNFVQIGQLVVLFVVTYMRHSVIFNRKVST